MIKKILYLIGALYLVLGLFILVISFRTITGFSISEVLQPGVNSILGLIVVSIGLLI